MQPRVGRICREGVLIILDGVTVAAVESLRAGGVDLQTHTRTGGGMPTVEDHCLS